MSQKKLNPLPSRTLRYIGNSITTAYMIMMLWRSEAILLLYCLGDFSLRFLLADGGNFLDLGVAHALHKRPLGVRFPQA